MNPKLEDAMLVQRHRRTSTIFRKRRRSLDADVVGDQNAEPAIGDPVEQSLVAPVERGAGSIESLDVEIVTHLHDHLARPGMEADHVASLDHDSVGFENALQIVVAYPLRLAAEMSVEVDHNRPALDAALRHVLDADTPRARNPGLRVVGMRFKRADHV